MKRKIISAVLYATTTFGLAEFFDSLYGGEPVTGHLVLIHLATAGAVLFAFASILSLVTLRAGVVCGLAGGVLSWPYAAIQIRTIPWGSVVRILPHSNWQDLLTVILVLLVSSIYSLYQLWPSVRHRSDSECGRFALRLFAVLFYAVGIFCLSMWHTIGESLIRFRH